ncbi:alpha/beta hydrolase [Sphingomonas floccifaciens]|uniref:Alpha/beta hydrolase n=1 Tax=Sphingomonas floccifaciens TaxID=1844115 RepID=A0ABW4NBQ3_9SPHN
MIQPPAERDAIAAMGTVLGPDVLARVQSLYRAEQDGFAATQPVAVADAAYGPHERQRLDLYTPAAPAAPVLLWVHGGGFVRGEKASDAHPYNAHVGRWAARNWLVGAVMNYRLLPDARWPSGGEDVAAAVDWLTANVAASGGDPARIVVAGTSAGAVHVATALQCRLLPSTVRGAVLLSGLYGAMAPEDRDVPYLGETSPLDPARIAAATGVPMLLACAEHDPARFQTETLALAGAVQAASGRLPRLSVVAGHNHFSLACHLGGNDTRLANDILDFVETMT